MMSGRTLLYGYRDKHLPKIVANKKEKISIPIIDAKKGRMLQARVPIITRTSSL